jgi:Rad3-related DNA helicase
MMSNQSLSSVSSAFPFPYSPYKVQLELMQQIFDCINNGCHRENHDKNYKYIHNLSNSNNKIPVDRCASVGIFESPTGKSADPCNYTATYLFSLS